MYMGAVIIFLFVLGLFLTRGTFRWWVMGLGVVTLLLSWGSHAMWFTRFFSEYIPLYNKFRTVSMILVIFQILFPLLGVVAVQQLLDGKFDKKHALKSLYWAGGLTAGFCLLAALIPSLSGSFLGGYDRAMGLPEEMIDRLQADRSGLLRADGIRSFCFILLTAGVLWFSINRKMKSVWVIAAIGALVLVDLWPMGKRYLNSDHFIRQREFQQQFAKRPVDEMILLDTDLYYRTLDISVVSTFNDSHTSYWHKTIGGYSPAKLQRYQEMIDHYIFPEINLMGNRLSTCTTWEEAEDEISAFPILNMLNTRYVIIQSDMPPLVNYAAFDNAWFCSHVVWVDTPDQEIETVGMVDLLTTAVIHKSFRELIPDVDRTAADSDASIRLTHYSPNALEFDYSSESPQLAVFSDVWYPKGWKAWIDDTPIEIARANYILRALPLPAGSHTIRFAFAPESYTKGAGYSRISSVLLLLGLAAGVCRQIKVYR